MNIEEYGHFTVMSCSEGDVFFTPGIHSGGEYIVEGNYRYVMGTMAIYNGHTVMTNPSLEPIIKPIPSWIPRIIKFVEKLERTK